MNTKRAHIFSNGPSLKTTTRLPWSCAAGARIAVNRAIKIVPDIDWLVFGDKIIVDEMQSGRLPYPRVGICAPLILHNAQLQASGLRCVPWEDLALPRDFGYSANIAIWFAFHRLRLDTLHLYGFDHHDGDHADGTPTPPRVPNRWAREIPLFEAVKDAVQREGAVVVRH